MSASKSPLSRKERRRIEAMSAAFRLLAEPARLAILESLSRGSPSVNDLSESIGSTQPATSHHLALMRVAGLVRAVRGGKSRFYEIEPDFLREVSDYLLSLVAGGEAAG